MDDTAPLNTRVIFENIIYGQVSTIMQSELLPQGLFLHHFFLVSVSIKETDVQAVKLTNELGN